MMNDIKEQACWLLLVFKSKISARVIHDIIAIWCQQLGRTLQEFFAADAEQWEATCQLSPKIIEKLEQAKGHLDEQVCLAEQLLQEQIHILTVLDDTYPRLLKLSFKRNQMPPVLCYTGNLQLLEHTTIAIIGSRRAGETSLAFTREAAQFLAEHDVNVISGNARGVDRTAFEGTISVNGYTTVVLPQGMCKLSQVQKQELLPKIKADKVLLLSQFHPEDPWFVSHAMERNKVVTGLAQVVIVAEANTTGGTWDAANSALAQKRPLYVCQAPPSCSLLPGNDALVERGARPLYWQGEELQSIDDVLSPLIQQSELLHEQQQYRLPLSQQLSLLLKEHGVVYDHA